MDELPRIGTVVNGFTVIALAIDETDPGDLVPVALLRKGDANFGDSDYWIARMRDDRELIANVWTATGHTRAWELFCERINAPEL